MKELKNQKSSPVEAAAKPHKVNFKNVEVIDPFLDANFIMNDSGLDDLVMLSVSAFDSLTRRQQDLLAEMLAEETIEARHYPTNACVFFLSVPDEESFEEIATKQQFITSAMGATCSVALVHTFHAFKDEED